MLLPSISPRRKIPAANQFDSPAIQKSRHLEKVPLRVLCSTLSLLSDARLLWTVSQNWQDVRESAVDVKTLVLQHLDSKDILLVIVPATHKVNLNKLATYLGTTRFCLAPSSRVEHLCGFPPGTVPVVGHSSGPFRTLLDATIAQQPNAELLSGGGHPDCACLLSVKALLALDYVEVAQLVSDKEEQKSFETVNGEGIENAPTQMDNISYKHFFPLAPPSSNINKTTMYGFNGEQALSPLLQPTPLTFIGKITGVRRMAKRLVFVDLAPPDADSTDYSEYSWMSALDCQEMTVQLIAGKTLCRALGDVDGPAALRRLKPGQLVLVRGKTNVGNPASLQNWETKRSLDIVVFSYDILEEAEVVGRDRVGRPASASDVNRIPSNNDPRPVNYNQAQTSYLTLSEIIEMSGACPSDGLLVSIVDSRASIHEFATELSQILLSLSTSQTPVMNGNANDTAALSIQGMEQVSLVGVDCEWKPSFMMNSPNEPQPVLLLQLYVQAIQRVFLFDLQSLFRPCMDRSQSMTVLESSASDVLLNLFKSRRLLKVGFQLGADLRRLASSYPHIPAFRAFNGVVEVSAVAKRAMHLTKQRSVRYHTNSLARLTEFIAGKSLDKEQQISDWSIRPLSPEQIEYASLDAAISPFLFETSLRMAEAGVIFEDTPEASTLHVGRWKDDTYFSKSIMSFRFMLLDTQDPLAVRKLKAKKVVGDAYVVTQCWPTEGLPPKRPSVPSSKGEYTDVNGVYRIPSDIIRIDGNANGYSHLVGERIGRSKEKCVESLLIGQAALPDGAKIEFLQRSGYVDFLDAAALFVNMPSKAYKRGYPNEWLDDGRVMTWYLSEPEWANGESPIARKLCGDPTLGSSPVPLILLFVRMNKGIFICCGNCRVVPPGSSESRLQNVTHPQTWSLVQLKLELLDWDTLQWCNDFRAMVTPGSSESHVPNVVASSDQQQDIR